MNDELSSYDLLHIAKYAAHLVYEQDTSTSLWPELLGFRESEKERLANRMIARRVDITG